MHATVQSLDEIIAAYRFLILSPQMGKETNFDFQLPPGFRFHPSDEELITHYLINKLKSNPLPADVVAEIELYNFNPWELPKKALFGEDEWFFFSPRDRKYPNGERPNRTASSGYWKATGTDKPILSFGSKRIGVKKALVFYTGRAPKGVKTNWLMSEYRLPETTKPSKHKGSMRLDDWVLCRVRHKGSISTTKWEEQGSPDKGLLGYYPKVEDLPSAQLYLNSKIITELQTRGCQALSTILTAQYLPQPEIPLYKHDTEDTSSILNIIFDLPKGAKGDGVMYGGLPENNTLSANTLEFYGQNEYKRDVFSSSLFNGITSLQGPNEKVTMVVEQAFAERLQTD